MRGNWHGAEEVWLSHVYGVGDEVGDTNSRTARTQEQVRLILQRTACQHRKGARRLVMMRTVSSTTRC